MRRIWVTLGSSLVAVLLAAVFAAGALAQGSDVRVSTPKRLYVVGTDDLIEVQAQLPAGCEDTDAQVGLFTKGGAARVNEVDSRFPLTAAKADQTAGVQATVRLSREDILAPVTAWPGVLSPCLEQPVVSTGPGLLIGIREGSSDAAAFLIPDSSLKMGRESQVVKGTLTAVVDGIECGRTDLEAADTHNPDGSVTLSVGGSDQPGECSKSGATVSFRYPDGSTLYEKRTLVPGVTQPFANLAPEAGAATGAPSSTTADRTSSGHSLQIFVLLAALLAPGVVLLLRRVRHGK